MAQGIEGFIPYINRKPLSDPLFLERARNPQDFPVLTSKEGGRDIYETHRMAHKAVQDSEGNIRGIAFPNIIFDGKELVNLPKRGINPADYALETGNYKLFDTVSEARDFAINYKKLPEFEALGRGPRSFEPGGVVEKERTPFEKNIDQNLKRIFYDSYNQNIGEDTRVEAIREQIKQDPNALERNREALQNLQDFTGYTFEPDSILEEVAAQEAFVRGTVPFGLEDQVYLGGTDNSVVYGVNSQNLETGVRRILMPGKFPSPRTPIHEGLHSFYSYSDLSSTAEELIVRALDLQRAKRSGDPEQIEAEKRSFRQYARKFPTLGQRDVEEALENTDDPKKIAKLDKKLNELIERNSRRIALVGSTQLSDKFYEGLRDSQKERLRRGAEKYINSKGQKIYDLSDEEFQDLLEYAPGFERMGYQPVLKKRYKFKPRNFNEGGVAGLAPMAQNMFTN